MKIVQNLDILRQKSQPVESVEEAKSIIASLEQTLGQHGHGVGLAAIQIGIPRRISIVRSDNVSVNLINPVVTEKEDEFIFHAEGCLSIPNLFVPTARYREYVVENNCIVDDAFETSTDYYYYDASDKESDISAIAVQHEIDHMDGILITDRQVEVKPSVRVTEKVARNDPCPCGATKSDGTPLKYKKCCGK